MCSMAVCAEANIVECRGTEKCCRVKHPAAWYLMCEHVVRLNCDTPQRSRKYGEEKERKNSRYTQSLTINKCGTKYTHKLKI